MIVGVIGSGRMGMIRASLLSQTPEVSRVLVGGRTAERAHAAVSEAEIDAEPMAIEDVFEAEPDAFVVAVATAAHESVLQRCLEHRKPVLCEKPLADSLEGTLSLVEEAKSLGVPIQVGFMRRHDPGFAAAREAVRDGALGTVYCIRIVSHDHEVGTDEFAEASGGIFQDLCVHDFDIVRWICGSEFEWLSATGAVREHQQYARIGDWDTCLIGGQLENGALVSISGCRHNPRGYDFRLELFGSRDSIAVGLTGQSPLRTVDEPGLLHGPVFRGFRDRFHTAFANETAAFVLLASKRGANPAPPEDAVAAYRVALACEESARDRRVVNLRDAATRRAEP